MLSSHPSMLLGFDIVAVDFYHHSDNACDGRRDMIE